MIQKKKKVLTWQVRKFLWRLRSYAKSSSSSVLEICVKWILRHIFTLAILLRDSFKEYSNDNAFQHGAALSYYAVFSLPPMLMVIIYSLGFFMGQENVKMEVLGYLTKMLGAGVAERFSQAIEHLQSQESSGRSALLGIGTLLFGSTVLFYSLQSSINIFWKVRPRIKQGILQVAWARLRSFAMVVTIGFIVVLSLIVETLVLTMDRFLSEFFLVSDFFSGFISYLSSFFHELGSFVISVLFFSIIFKYLPDAKVKWKDVWLGAIFTTVLFKLGQGLIDWYISQSNFSDFYGAAGFIMVLLTWVFYSSQILFFGTEFTFVVAKKFERDIQPSPFAVKIERTERELESRPETNASTE
ncbi:YihY/virulence factor BrkB family protein [Rapidithrix thailandica]|uniref:YihY/virulence factor BrkB family protein n=1 Tax=Rapidithrix thailandica TaxID=413964 RepID=A0AAW9SID6_9BACT